MASASEKSTGIAIVTGASAGIGQELARELSSRGRRVLAVARRAERLEALANEARLAGRAEIIPFAADITDAAARTRVVEKARSLGAVEWLVNNAGVMNAGPFASLEGAKVAGEIHLNCEALVAMTHAVLPELLGQKRGVVLNTASTAGLQATPFMTVYGATKAFVISFTEGLSEELRGTGVTVTALCPGPVETEIFEVSAAGVPRKKTGRDMSAQDAARAGIDAAERGVVIAVPGAMNNVMALASKLMPRALIRWSTGRMGLTSVGLPRTGRRT